PAGQLAVWHGPADGAVRPAAARPAAPPRGGRDDDAIRPGRADGPAGRRGGHGPGRIRGAARRDRAAAPRLPDGRGAGLPRGRLRRGGRAATAMVARHGPQPDGPGAEKLRRGLLRRGVVLPAAVLEAQGVSASISPPCAIPPRGPRSVSRPDRPPARPS